MARRKYQMDEKKIARFIKEGRGQGEGKFYKPWIRVDEIPSIGRVHRVPCTKTGREHHLLSDNEYYFFLHQWWDDDVIDIREQFPLFDRYETLEIALLCRVNHPSVNGVLTVMTTDLLVTLRPGCGKPGLQAYAVKEAKDLTKQRTREKLEIERRYWERRDVFWHIVTNRDVKNTFTHNLRWILDPDQTLYKDVHDRNIDDMVLDQLARIRLEYPRMPIRLACQYIDQKFLYRQGTSLAAIRRLLCSKRLRTDLTVMRLQDAPVETFEF